VDGYDIPMSNAARPEKTMNADAQTIKMMSVAYMSKQQILDLLNDDEHNFYRGATNDMRQEMPNASIEQINQKLEWLR
jgi:hypothetical protein